jgi:hypothetical protein
MVAEHDMHFFVGTNGNSFGGGSGDARPISRRVTSHFRSPVIGIETVYNLSEPRA